MADSDLDTTTGAQPSDVSTTPAPGGESPANEHPDFNAADAIERLDNEADIAGILFGESPAPDSPAPQGALETPPATPAAPEPPAAAADAGDTPPNPQPEQSPPAAEEPQPKAPDRLRLTSLDPDDRELNARAVEMVRNKEAKNLVEAVLALTGKTAATQVQPTEGEPEPAPAAAPEPARQDDPDVTRIQSELADLRSKRTKAIEDYDRATEANLTSEIEDKLVELQEAKAEARHRTASEAAYAAQHRDAVAKVKATYPESEDPESAFSQAMVDALDLASYRRDPILERPDHLVLIAEKVARQLGKSATPAPATVTTPPPPPARHAVPVGTGAPGHGQRTQVSREQLTALIEDADEETIGKALWGI